MYQAGFSPLQGRFNNRMETYNEVLVYIISLHMMLFTPFVEREKHELMGYSMISFVLLYLGSNMMLVAIDAIWTVLLLLKKYYIRIKACFRKKVNAVGLEPAQ